MYVLGLPACLRAALSRSVVGSHVGHTRAARGGAFGVERPETPFQTIIGTRNRDRNMVAQRFLENRRWFARDRSDARSTVPGKTERSRCWCLWTPQGQRCDI